MWVRRWGGVATTAAGLDARRYNQMALVGWTLLRFTWEDVVLRPELVAATLTSAVKRRPKVA